MATPGPPASIVRLRSTVRDLVSLATAAPERLGRSPAEGEWSPATIICHLADAEMIYSVRLRTILTAGYPELATFDEVAWAERFSDADPKLSLGRWRPLREANLRVFDSLEEEEWELSGHHPTRGEVSVSQLADLLATHDREHLDQLREALAH